MNDNKRKAFETDIGQKAIVEHHSLGGSEVVAQLREVLVDSALDLQNKKVVHPELEYLGSLSVHVYASQALRQFSFVGITNPHKMTHPVADAAVSKLKQDVREFFRGKRQKLRSGF